MSRPSVSPGTVSKILWHFTGGPLWDAEKERQGSSPKPVAKAYRNLKSILTTRQLRLGSYREIVKVVIPLLRTYDRKSGKPVVKRNMPGRIVSSAVCCLADIPAPHLRYHSYRYGKFAIGFHREAAVDWGFNPVLYTLEDTPIVRSVYQGFAAFDFADPDAIGGFVDSLESELSSMEEAQEAHGVDVSEQLADIQEEVRTVSYAMSDAKGSLEELTAFVKSFKPKEFATIYCEREWRTTRAWDFNIDDGAMIVVPRAENGKQYYRPFVEKFLPKQDVPRRIPVVPWDDLIEH